MIEQKKDIAWATAIAKTMSSTQTMVYDLSGIYEFYHGLISSSIAWVCLWTIGLSFGLAVLAQEKGDYSTVVRIDVSSDGVTYRCAKPCSYNKKCFVIKTKTPIRDRIVVLQKCPARQKRDIPLIIQEE